MTTFDHIAIIYNPESTGDAKDKAESLARQIDDNAKIIGISGTLTPTKHARHAIKLSKEIGLNYKRPLIVSVSGDGDYNEVVNGAMQAKLQSRTANPVVAVVGAGNANDHRRVMRDTPLINLIKKAEPKSFDLLHIQAKTKGFSVERFAHSYIGFGVTPQVGHELNKHSKSIWSEIKTILKTYKIYAPFSIDRNGRTYPLDNLVFANINEMAKVIKLDEKNTVRDGKFEVIAIPHQSKLSMLATLFGAAIIGFYNVPSYKSYSFKCIDSLPIQLDGEIEQLQSGCEILVTSKHRAIDSLF